MQFLDKYWVYMGTRTELSRVLSKVTGIHVDYLDGTKDFRDASIAMKMSWQAKRKATRPEDMAYSMLGLFDVVLPPAYGEGSNAFRRLQEQILQQSDDESIFAWTTDFLPRSTQPDLFRRGEWGLLAPSPACFEGSRDITNEGPMRPRAHGGYRMTQRGIQFPMPILNKPRSHSVSAWVDRFLDGLSSSRAEIRHAIIMQTSWKEWSRREGLPLPLNCWRRASNGAHEPVVVYLTPHTSRPPTWKRFQCHYLGRWDLRVPASDVDRYVRSDVILQPREEHSS